MTANEFVAEFAEKVTELASEQKAYRLTQPEQILLTAVHHAFHYSPEHKRFLAHFLFTLSALSDRDDGSITEWSEKISKICNDFLTESQRQSAALLAVESMKLEAEDNAKEE